MKMDRNQDDVMPADVALHQAREFLYGRDYESELDQWSRMTIKVDGDRFVWVSPSAELSAKALRSPTAVAMSLTFGGSSIQSKQCDDGSYNFAGDFIKAKTGSTTIECLLPEYFGDQACVEIEISNGVDAYVVWHEMTWRDRKVPDNP